MWAKYLLYFFYVVSGVGGVDVNWYWYLLTQYMFKNKLSSVSAVAESKRPASAKTDTLQI